MIRTICLTNLLNVINNVRDYFNHSYELYLSCIYSNSNFNL